MKAQVRYTNWIIYEKPMIDSDENSIFQESYLYL